MQGSVLTNFPLLIIMYETNFFVKYALFYFHYTIHLQVEFDIEGKVCGVTSEGETAKCKKVVCDPSYLPNKVNPPYPYKNELLCLHVYPI